MNLNNLSKTAVLSTSACSTECKNILLKAALSLNQSPTQANAKIVEKISNDHNVSKHQVVELLGIYIAIVRLFLESTDKEFNSKLLELGFSSEFVTDLPLVSNRSKVVETILQSRRGQHYKLVSLKWRIDISLTNSALVKKIPTSVILCLQRKNGQKCTINVNIRTFHKLRYNVALIMKEVADLKINH